MPRLSPPHGRQAAARTEPPKEDELKSSSVKLTDNVSNTSVEAEDQIADVPTDPPQDDASIAFKKQIEALKESERIHRERAEQAVLEREDAIRRANEREAEVNRLQKTTAESHAETIAAGIAAATAEAEGAQRDIERALELGDHKGHAEAYRKLAKAETSIARLEDGKAELEAQIAQDKITQEQRVNDPIENSNVPSHIKSWLRSHPEYISNPKLNAKIQNLHWVVVDDEGLEPYSREYLKSIEIHLGMREPTKAPEPEDDQVTRGGTNNVSAPVSRESPPSSSGERPGQVRLTVLQKEAAKIAGITEKDYAENLLKLKAEKLNGNYGGAP